MLHGNGGAAWNKRMERKPGNRLQRGWNGGASAKGNGRKNNLFLGSDAGGKSAATIYSLIATCRRHRINPSEYLADVLVRISTHPAAAIEDLAPFHWQPAHTA